MIRPSRHVDNRTWFEQIRMKLNYVLSFEGFEITESGSIKYVNTVKTFSEAEERASQLKRILIDRNIHPDEQFNWVIIDVTECSIERPKKKSE